MCAKICKKLKIKYHLGQASNNPTTKSYLHPWSGKTEKPVEWVARIHPTSIMDTRIFSTSKMDNKKSNQIRDLIHLPRILPDFELASRQRSTYVGETKFWNSIKRRRDAWKVKINPWRANESLFGAAFLRVKILLIRISILEQRGERIDCITLLIPFVSFAEYFV